MLWLDSEVPAPGAPFAHGQRLAQGCPSPEDHKFHERLTSPSDFFRVQILVETFETGLSESGPFHELSEKFAGS